SIVETLLHEAQEVGGRQGSFGAEQAQVDRAFLRVDAYARQDEGITGWRDPTSHEVRVVDGGRAVLRWRNLTPGADRGITEADDRAAVDLAVGRIREAGEERPFRRHHPSATELGDRLDGGDRRIGFGVAERELERVEQPWIGRRIGEPGVALKNRDTNARVGRL